MVIAGHSQGGGHAGVIAKNHDVARVLFFASPVDFNYVYNQPARWINSDHKTPPIRYFAFTHSEDNDWGMYDKELIMFSYLGMSVYGQPVNVDKSSPPYSGSHIFTSTRQEDSQLAYHMCIVHDA